MRLTSTSIIRASFLLALFLTGPAVIAETIKIPVGQQTIVSKTARPTLGMSQETVEKQFGSPIEVVAAKGQPPISRWIYEDFVVYFEYNTVLHSVVKHQPQIEQ